MKIFFMCIILFLILTYITISQPIDIEELKLFLEQKGFVENINNLSFFNMPELLYAEVMGKSAPEAQVHAELCEEITYNYYIYDFEKPSGKLLVFFVLAWFEIDGKVIQFYNYNKDLIPCNTKKWMDYNRDNKEQAEEVFYIWF